MESVLLSSMSSTMMAKSGRNDPCPCGSGNKYKKCCLTKHEAADREGQVEAEAERAARAEAHRLHVRELKAAFAARMAGVIDHEEDELTVLSNAAVDLVNAGKLDEAEKIARNLLQRFPEVHDGWDRLGMVHEARGETAQAADCYRKVIDVIGQQPDAYDPEFAAVYTELVDRLTAPVTA
jgi:tetratricopeptide (TPR) repeat protein